MVSTAVIPLTTSQVNKAGKALRAWWAGADLPEEEFQHFGLIVIEYRASHRKPLKHANMGLRSVVQSQGCHAEVSQRLKQMRTIIDKLARHPNMGLSTMQDIGGCRAILRDIDEIRRVQRKLVKNSMERTGFVKVDDYIAKPRASGYRGVHVIVHYGDPLRSIEIQLRTEVMHQWAFTVERLGGKIDQDLKSGIGPPEVLRLMEAVSEAMELEELGKVVDSTLVERINTLRRDALPFMVARQEGGQAP
jgi:putative GTP pyrophosphokinase